MADGKDFAKGGKALTSPGKNRDDGADQVDDGTATPAEQKTPSVPSNPSNP